jgi:hypothetical protein
MKKLALGSMIVLALFSCNSGGNENNTGTEGGPSPATENPSAIEDSSTQHPTGITNQNVISTDTSAMTPPDNTEGGNNAGTEKKQ